MVTTFLRILKYGLQSFWRNGWLSLAAVMVMIWSLTVFEGLNIFSVMTRTAISALQDKIDISVYFKITAPEDDILKLERSLESLKEVKSVDYISRDKALELFKAKNIDNPAISQALRALEDNPLLASLNIQAHDPQDYASIANQLKDPTLQPIIENVTFDQSRLAIERLTSIVSALKKFGIGLTIFFALTAALVTFNTIRLAIYSNREEIGVMRLVGASNAFIKGPYVVEGVLYGVVAALFSLVIIAPLINGVSGGIQRFIPEMDLQSYFYANLFKLFEYQLLFGVGLGVLSSLIAIRRYLRI